MSVVDIRVRNTKKGEKYFNYSAVPFPEAAEILSDQIMEQMMMDGSVSCKLLFLPSLLSSFVVGSRDCIYSD